MAGLRAPKTYLLTMAMAATSWNLGGAWGARAGAGWWAAWWAAQVPRTALPRAFMPPALAASCRAAGVDMPAAQRHLDFVNIMTYDYHGPSWEPGTVNYLAPWTDVSLPAAQSQADSVAASADEGTSAQTAAANRLPPPASASPCCRAARSTLRAA